ncbi:beta-ketoacyl-ACP synthase III [Anaerosinus sp.]|uniref:beta-ketoacyl-ACP synthase III n=1 Tax=Selenobaculum sp. TaxID=3074374 RepID=UPI003AB235AA
MIGTGYYAPEKVVTNADLEKMVDTNNEWIIDRTGISERRIVDDNIATSDIAVKAAQNALADAGVKPEEIDLIIVATLTPDMVFPSAACVVQNKLQAVNAAAFDLSAACSGFVYAMSVGSQFIQSGMYKKVLIVAAESLSKITNWEDRNTCVLFGDGAGAAVLGPVEEGYGILGVELGADGSGAEFLHMPAGGSLYPATLETVKNKMHYIHMNGNEVFKFAIKIMGEAAYKALEDAGLDTKDVDCLIPHQANIRIIKSAAKRLHLPMDKVFVNVNKYGNTSAASIPIALAEAVKERHFKKGDIIVLVGFGAGLTWASCVLKWSKEE